VLVAGIDPGSHRTGYALLDVAPGRVAPVAFGVIAPRGKDDLAARILVIHEKLRAIVEERRPQEAALEDIFHHKNALAAFKLGQARGAIVLTLALAGVPVFSYPPALVKKCVAAYGAAGKEQVGAMVRALLGIREEVPADATDALALAITHARVVQTRLSLST